MEEQPAIALLDDSQNLSKTFEMTIEDIFRKFDLHIGRELSHDEFQILYKCMSDKVLTMSDFKQKFLSKYCSTEEGITMRGLK